MLISIVDTCPGAGVGRTKYLESRAIRELEAAAAKIGALELTLDTVKGDDGDPRFRAVAVLTMKGGATHDVSLQRRSLPLCLADLFETLAFRAKNPTPGTAIRSRAS